jgi:hypothetical protein
VPLNRTGPPVPLQALPTLAESSIDALPGALTQIVGSAFRHAHVSACPHALVCWALTQHYSASLPYLHDNARCHPGRGSVAPPFSLDVRLMRVRAHVLRYSSAVHFPLTLWGRAFWIAGFRNRFHTPQYDLHARLARSSTGYTLIRLSWPALGRRLPFKLSADPPGLRPSGTDSSTLATSPRAMTRTNRRLRCCTRPTLARRPRVGLNRFCGLPTSSKAGLTQLPALPCPVRPMPSIRNRVEGCISASSALV